MILRLDKAIPAELCESIVSRLSTASFTPGTATSGKLDRSIKHSLQLPLRDPLAKEISRDLTRSLGDSDDFANAARLKQMTPPRVNRYDIGMYYQEHLDNALMVAGRSPLRTDIAMTICLNSAADYEGGELVVQGEGGEQRFRGDAGDVILYPAGNIHEVTEVTAGSRLVAVGWIQSQVRDPAQRRVLYDLDKSLKALDAEGVTRELRLPLQQIRSQLVRMWSDA